MSTILRPTLAIALAVAVFALGAQGEAQARLGSSGSSAASPGSRSTATRPSGTSDASRSRTDSAQSSRLGGGRSVGMQREETLNAARAEKARERSRSFDEPRRSERAHEQRPAPRAPQYAPVAPQRAPSTPRHAAPERSDSRSWVVPALAGAAVGALAGHALANDDRAPAQTPSAAPAPVPGHVSTDATVPEASEATRSLDVGSRPAAADINAPATAAVAPVASSGTAERPSAVQSATEGAAGYLGPLALLGLGVLVIFGLLRLLRSPTVPSMAAPPLSHRDAAPTPLASRSPAPARPAHGPTPSLDKSDAGAGRVRPAELFDQLETVLMRNYHQFQAMNNDGDLVGLRRHMTPELFDAIEQDIREREQPSATVVVDLTVSVLSRADEGGQLVLSARYQGHVDEMHGYGPEPVDEVFHYVHDKTTLGTWRVAGIEQV